MRYYIYATKFGPQKTAVVVEKNTETINNQPSLGQVPVTLIVRTVKQKDYMSDIYKEQLYKDRGVGFERDGKPRSLAETKDPSLIRQTWRQTSEPKTQEDYSDESVSLKQRHVSLSDDHDVNRNVGSRGAEVRDIEPKAKRHWDKQYVPVQSRESWRRKASPPGEINETPCVCKNQTQCMNKRDMSEGNSCHLFGCLRQWNNTKEPNWARRSEKEQIHLNISGLEGSKSTSGWAQKKCIENFIQLLNDHQKELGKYFAEKNPLEEKLELAKIDHCKGTSHMCDTCKRLIRKVAEEINRIYQAEKKCPLCNNHKDESTKINACKKINKKSNFHQLCFGCNLPIREVVVIALGRTWHMDHFVCSSCGIVLSNSGYCEKDSKAYCDPCYEKLLCSDHYYPLPITNKGDRSRDYACDNSKMKQYSSKQLIFYDFKNKK